MTPRHTESVAVMPQNVQYDNFEKNEIKVNLVIIFTFIFELANLMLIR